MLEISLSVSIITSLVIGFGITVFQYLKFKGKALIYLWMALFRFLGVFCVIMLVISPEVKRNETFVDKHILHILVDNSSSIYNLGYDSLSRMVIEELAQDKSIQEQFDVDTLIFAKQIIAHDSLRYNGKHTNIYQALQLSLEPHYHNPNAI